MQINKKTIDQLFLSTVGEDLVPKLMMQMSKIKGFTDLFGPYKSDDTGLKNSDQQRWADYNRMDWSMRQLPAINVFESQVESKQSDNAYLTGNISIQVYWPASFRRSDLTRIPVAFRGALLAFFTSIYATDMLDELYFIQRPAKVFGLNEIGKSASWSPNVEGVIDSEMVPVTILEVPYRIDLRAWYRALEYMGRTKEIPFAQTLDPLAMTDFLFQGVDNTDATPVWVEIESRILLNNP